MNPDEQKQRRSAIAQLKSDLAKLLEEAQAELNEIVQTALVKFKEQGDLNEVAIKSALANTEQYVRDRGKEWQDRMDEIDKTVIKYAPLALPGWQGRWERIKWLWDGRN